MVHSLSLVQGDQENFPTTFLCGDGCFTWSAAPDLSDLKCISFEPMGEGVGLYVGLLLNILVFPRQGASVHQRIKSQHTVPVELDGGIVGQIAQTDAQQQHRHPFFYRQRRNNLTWIVAAKNSHVSNYFNARDLARNGGCRNSTTLPGASSKKTTRDATAPFPPPQAQDS